MPMPQIMSKGLGLTRSLHPCPLGGSACRDFEGKIVLRSMKQHVHLLFEALDLLADFLVFGWVRGFSGEPEPGYVA